MLKTDPLSNHYHFWIHGQTTNTCSCLLKWLFGHFLSTDSICCSTPCLPHCILGAFGTGWDGLRKDANMSARWLKKIIWQQTLYLEHDGLVEVLKALMTCIGSEIYLGCPRRPRRGSRHITTGNDEGHEKNVEWFHSHFESSLLIITIYVD